MTQLAAHLSCAALVLLDQVARALRIRLLTATLGHRITFRQALSTNLIGDARSEEHTSELQSRYVISYAVFCFWREIGRASCRERVCYVV